MGCLCGCGADNQHCYLPNRSPSPNTLFENIYAPTFAQSLESSLRRVITKSEPSKRVWWRKTYGGDAQDESSPRFERRYPLQCGRSHSPALSSDSERLQQLNKKICHSSIPTEEPSGPNQQYCSGLYSPPLDSCPKERPREDPSQMTIRRARASRFQTLRDTFRRRAGFDVTTPFNVQNTSLESQIERPYLEFLPKLFDYPPPSMQLGPVPESAKEYEQLSDNQACDPPKLQNQHHYDVPVQPAHLLAFQPPPPERHQKNSTERYRTEFPQLPSPTNQTSISQGPRKEEMQGSVMRQIEDEQCQPKSDHMTCVCGLDTHDHLHNLLHRPPSPNTLLEGSWTPESVDMSVARLGAVPSKYEPPRRVLWRQTYGGEAQDTIPQQNKLGEPTKFSDETRGREMLISGLLTPNPNETEAEVKQNSLCESKDPISLRFGGSVIRCLSKPPRGKASECREAQKQQSPNNEEDPRISLPAKGDMHILSSGSQENLTTTALPNVFDLDQPIPDSLVERAHSKPFQFDQGDLGCGSAPIYAQRDQLKTLSDVKHSHIRCSTSQASHKPSWTREDIRRSVRRKAQELDPTDRVEEQAPISRAPPAHACLCGCGGDAIHCLLPNRPPSPNTFYENFGAPNFTSRLSARLDAVRRRFEPSKRIWWREEFGGCAPDREPLDSEIRDVTYNELGDVLRTSPPAFSDESFVLESMNEEQGQSPRRCQYSTSPPKTPIRSADETAITLPQEVTSGLASGSDDIALYASGGKWTREPADREPKLTLSHQSLAWLSNPFGKAKASKSPTYRIDNTISSLEIPEYRSRRPDLSETESPSGQKRVMSQRQLEDVKLTDSRRLGISKEQCANAAARGPKYTVDNVFIREVDKKPAKRFVNDLSRSSFRAPVRPHFRSPKSPTHYIPDRLPPLDIPDFSKRRPVRHKRKELTAEEDEQLLQSALRKLEASRLERLRLHGIPIKRGILAGEKSQSSLPSPHVVEVPSNTETEKLTNAAEDIIQMDHPVYGKIKAMNMRRSLRHGTAIYRHEDSAAKDSPSLSQGVVEEILSDTQVTVHGVEDILSDTPLTVNNPSTEKPQQWTQSLSQKIEALKLRRSRRQGAAIYRSDDAPAKSSASISHSIHEEEVPSDTQIKEDEASSEEHQRWRQLLYSKVEAMKLRRSLCQGTAIYRDDIAVVESSPSTSHGNYDEVPSDAQVKGSETPAEEYQRWTQSLYQKIEAMKLRRNRRQGVAIYRDDDAVAESSPPISHSIQVDVENETSVEEQHRWRQSLYQKIRVMKLSRNGRQGICIYPCEDTAFKCSTSTSLGNHVDMENATYIEEHQLWRQSLYQSIEAMKLRRNGRCGTSIYRPEDTAVESSTPISKVDYFAGMSNTSLPTSLV